MDNNRKDIGRAIRNKLEGMQQQPSAGGWDKLRAELDSGKKKRGIYNWLWLLTFLILVPAITITYFTGVFSTENSKDKKAKTPVETTLTGTYTTGPGTDTPGVETHNTKGSNTGSKNTMAGTAGITTNEKENSGIDNQTDKSGTTNDANNTTSINNKANADLNNFDSKSDKRFTDVTTEPGKRGKKATTLYNDENNRTSDKSKATQSSVASKNGRAGSLEKKGSVTNTLAHGPARNNAINTGVAVAKDKIAALKPNGGQQVVSIQDTSQNNIVAKRQVANTTTVNPIKKQLVKAGKQVSKGIANTTTSQVVGNENDPGVNRSLASERVAINTTVSAEESNTLIASTATIIFTETLTKNDSTTVALVTNSLAHECNEKIDSIANPDDKTKDKSNETPYKRYYAFTYAAPSQYVYNSGRSLIDGSLNGIKTETKTSVNYGAFLGYEATRNWGLRAGVLINRLERNTRGAVLDTIGGHQNYAGIKYIPGLNNNMLGDLFKGAPFNIIQKTDMLEVPLEVTYRLGGNRWGSKLIAGFSMVHVRTNNVFVQGGHYNVALGSLTDTKQTSLTAGFGAGLYYEVLPNLQINAEPFIRYHINTFGKGNYLNTFNDSNPFSLSIRVGVQYNFDLFKK